MTGKKKRTFFVTPYDRWIFGIEYSGAAFLYFFSFETFLN